jgi:hypothetical protein
VWNEEKVQHPSSRAPRTFARCMYRQRFKEQRIAALHEVCNPTIVKHNALHSRARQSSEAMTARHREQRAIGIIATIDVTANGNAQALRRVPAATSIRLALRAPRRRTRESINLGACPPTNWSLRTFQIMCIEPRAIVAALARATAGDPLALRTKAIATCCDHPLDSFAF